MPRTIQLSVSSMRTDDLVRRIEKQRGLIGLEVQKGASVQPPGDVIRIHVLNRDMHDLLRVLKQSGITEDASSSLVTTEMSSVVSSPSNDDIIRDSAESSWEEMEMMVGKESNMTINAMLVMAASGVIAATGIITGALHIVIAAMVIAPGFEPVLRITLGLAAGSRTWRHGFVDIGKGYGALIVGAAAALLLAHTFGATASYLAGSELVSYWSTISWPSLLVSATASAVGAILVVTNRSVLTAGVMIALALVPAPVVMTMGVLTGDLTLAGRGLLRWLVEIGLVLLMSAIVFGWKRTRIQRRQMLW